MMLTIVSHRRDLDHVPPACSLDLDPNYDVLLPRMLDEVPASKDSKEWTVNLAGGSRFGLREAGDRVAKLIRSESPQNSDANEYIRRLSPHTRSSKGTRKVPGQRRQKDDRASSSGMMMTADHGVGWGQDAWIFFGSNFETFTRIGVMPGSRRFSNVRNPDEDLRQDRRPLPLERQRARSEQRATPRCYLRVAVFGGRGWQYKATLDLFERKRGVAAW